MRKLRLALQSVVSAAFVCLVVYGMSSMADAQITSPTLADGVYLPPTEAPCVAFNVGQATGTVEIEARTSGPGYVSWVIVSSHSALGYTVLRDTGAASNTGIYPVARLSGSTTASTVYTFSPPMRFANGLTVAKSRPDMETTVCTRLYGTQVP